MVNKNPLNSLRLDRGVTAAMLNPFLKRFSDGLLRGYGHTGEPIRGTNFGVQRSAQAKKNPLFICMIYYYIYLWSYDGWYKQLFGNLREAQHGRLSWRGTDWSGNGQRCRQGKGLMTPSIPVQNAEVPDVSIHTGFLSSGVEKEWGA